VVAPSITPPAGAVEAATETREDLFGFDPAFRDRVKAAFVFLHDRYFRVETTGVHHIPATGPVIFVANHSGAIPIDGAMIVTTVDRHAGRAVRFLYDRFVENLGPVSAFYRRVGGVVAARENALAVLPLPTKWFIRFGKPIRLPQVEGEARWQRARQEAVSMRRKVQAMVTRLRARRQSIFFG